MEFVIETEKLVKRYGNRAAVDHVDLHVQAGDIYGLIGRNGAGKTTLMRTLLGLTDPDEGRMTIFGGDRLYESRRRIGSIIEEPGLYYGKTAYDNLKAFSLLYDRTSDIRPEELLQKVGLENTGKKKVREFSLGMRQRLGIAAALMGKPDLLILDEPINGLDPTGIKEIRDLILELNAEGVTFMISSHLLDELGKIATRYGIMTEGALTEELSAQELKERCRRYVSAAVDRREDAVRLLRQKIPGIDIREGEDMSSFNILSEIEDTSGVSELLVSGGIKLYSICRQGITFEDYFLRKLEAGA